MLQLFISLFKYIGVKFTYPYLHRMVNNTPYGDSMFGVRTILTRYNVPHVCVRFSDKSIVSEGNKPSIVIYKGQFVIITDIMPNRHIAYIVDGVRRQVQIDEFIKYWNGIAILIDQGLDMKEENYALNIKNKNKTLLKRVTAVIGVAILVMAGIVHAGDSLFVVRMVNIFVSSAGLYVSYLLLLKQLHIPNKIVEKICGLSRQGHCESVTESDASSLFGLVKFSEVGFGFFLTNVICLLFIPQYVSWLAIYAVVVLPFTFWSIWFQKYRAKSWCALCLSTLLAMWMQAGVYLVGGAFRLSLYGIETPIMIGAAYVVAILGVNKGMSLIAAYRKIHEENVRGLELKTNDKTIDAFEKDADVFDVNEDTCSSLIFGNPLSDKTITVFSNPFCGPCALMHNNIKTFPLDCVKIQYVMTSFSDDKSVVNKAIIAVYQQLGADRAWSILSEWFQGGKKNGLDFFKQFNIDIDAPEVAAEFAKQQSWATDKRLYGTPTDLLNGREIVWPYSIEDYIYLS